MPSSRKEKRTYADRRDYLKAAVVARRRKLKEMLVGYKGGKCMLCGYDRCAAAFDLHHIDGSKKEFGIGLGGITRSWERVRAEADKCVLLCANCHRELHAGLISLGVQGVAK